MTMVYNKETHDEELSELTQMLKEELTPKAFMNTETGVVTLQLGPNSELNYASWSEFVEKLEHYAEIATTVGNLSYYTKVETVVHALENEGAEHVAELKKKNAAIDDLKRRVEIDPITGNIYAPITPYEVEPEKEDDNLSIHQQARLTAKSMVGKKYSIGDRLALKGSIKDGSKKEYKIFVVKKVIWAIKGNVRNILIMKRESGESSSFHTLSKPDCKKYHIKYEPGLEVWPMELPWQKRKKVVKKLENKVEISK